MPYQVDSPLGSALGAAGAFLTAQQQAKKDQQQAALEREQQRQAAVKLAIDQQNADSLASLRTTQANVNSAKAQQITAILPYLPDEQRAQIAALLGKGDLEGAEAALDKARVGLTNAQTTKTNAETKEILSGRLPLLQADAAAKRLVPQFERDQLAYKYAALDATEREKAQDLAARVNIAGANQNERMIIAAMTIENGRYTKNESQAFQQALAQYRADEQDYLQQMRANDASQAAGGPALPVGPKPAFNITTSSSDPALDSMLAALIARGLGPTPTGGGTGTTGGSGSTSAAAAAARAGGATPAGGKALDARLVKAAKDGVARNDVGGFQAAAKAAGYSPQAIQQALDQAQPKGGGAF